MPSLQFLSLFLCFQLLSWQSVAQLPDLAFDHYNVEDGLSQSTVWNIFEDSKGLIWFCTTDGLNKFDGYSFTVYRNHKSDSHSIASNHPVFMFEDSTGDLWIGHHGGLSKYDSRRDRFTQVYQLPVVTSEEEGLIPVHESDGMIWAWDRTRGIVGFNRKTLQEEIIHEAPDVYRKYEYANSRYAKTIDNKVFISSTGDAMVVFDFNTLKYTFLFNTDLEPDYQGILTTNKFATDNNKNIWIPGQDGVVRMNTRTLERKQYKKNFSGLSLTSCAFGPDGNLWVGSITNGLFLMDTVSGNSININRANNRRDGLLNNYIESLCMDSSGNMWIGTNGFGIHKYSKHKNKFAHISLQTSFGSNLVKAITEDERGSLYVGTYANGLYRVLRNGDVTNFSVPGNNTATGLAIGSDGEVIVSNDQGAFVLKGKAVVPMGIKPIPGNITSLYQRASQEVLMTTEKGVLHLVREAGQYTGEAMWATTDMLNTTVLFEDSKGRMWIGTQRSFFLVDESGMPRIMEHVTTNYVKSFCEDASGNIWIATIGDLVRFDPEHGQVERLNEKDGFINTFFYAALPGNDGKIWVSSNHGLASYDPVRKTVKNYTIHDGLQSEEFNTGAFCALKDGRLAFGGLNGLNIFNPQSITQNPNLPRIVLTNFLVDDQPFNLDTTIFYKKHIDLPYTRNTFSFEFSGLEYTSPENNRYAYMLEGLDKDWVEGGNVRFARYSRIAPGHYEFKVKATNSDGIWTETPASIFVVIRPPFYLQSWFLSLMSLVAVLLIAGISVAVVRTRYRSRLRQLEVDNKVQLERGRISRDLHDHVGSQLTFIINQLDGPPQEIIRKDQLSEAREAARETMGNLRETIWALNRETITVVDFSDRVKEFAMKQLKAITGMQLDFNEHLTSEGTLNPSKALNLFRIAQEVINNVVKHSQCTILSILIQNSEGSFKIRIADNGRGFHPSNQKSEGHGLQNIAYRVKEIDGKLEVTTDAEMGTAVTITLVENKVIRQM